MIKIRRFDRHAGSDGRDPQGGFTLIELLISAVLALVLLLTTTTILFQTFEFVDRQRIRPVLNDTAREMFDLLGDGGAVGTNDLLGMRDRSTFAEANASSLRANNILQLDNPTSSPTVNYTSIGPETSSVTINCRATGNPVAGCVGTGTQAVQGYLARDPRLYIDSGGTSDRSLDDAERTASTNRTIEAEILLIQPHQANRERFRPDVLRESYRTIFTLNRTP